MKNLILISIAILLLTNISYTQGIEETFTAKEAINDVLDQALIEGITDPVIVGIGLAPGEYVIPGIGTLNPELDLTNGQSSIWLYLIAEKNDISNTISIAVIKFFSGFIPMTIDIDLSSIPINYINPILVDWINSDVLCQKLNANAIFSNFVEDNQAIFDFVTLDYQDAQELNGMGNLNEGPYWLLSCSKDNGESIICFTDAVSGATTCFNATGVEDEQSDNYYTISPNPATDILIITANSEGLTNTADALIIDSKGNILEKINLDGAINKTIDISNLPTGAYTVIIGNTSKRFVKVY